MMPFMVSMMQRRLGSGVSIWHGAWQAVLGSPVANRKEGGGYEPFDPESEEAQAELRRQAGVSLAAWLNRYRGCTENIGMDVGYVEEMVCILRDDKEADVA